MCNLDDGSGPGTHWPAYIKRGYNVQYIGDLPHPLELKLYQLSSDISFSTCHKMHTKFY